MNQEAFEQGKRSYQSGDFSGAVQALTIAKSAGELTGELDHLLGNAYMRLGQFGAAAEAYQAALRDTSYGKRGPLSCNQGRALLAAGKIEDAIAALTVAASDQTYTTPYKAYLALGSAYEQLGDVRNAGVAYRNAAIDESNPKPSEALCKLGQCFMRMSRPVDAVEAYRTALDFTSPLESHYPIYADLALAYVASNKLSEAVDAFGQATADGTYQLSAEAQASYEAAQKALAARSLKNGPSETDQLLASAGYGTLDPLDPTGESGAFIPSPEDTGFFDISEEDLIKEDAADRKVRRKHKHRGLKILLAFLIVIVLAGGACFGALWMGYGWPTQESVVAQVFETRSTDGDLSRYLAVNTAVNADELASMIPQYASVKVTGVDRSRTQSTVYAVSTLSGGGEQDFTFTMVRDGIGWKISNVKASFASQQ